MEIDLNGTLASIAKTFGAFTLVWLSYQFSKFWLSHSMEEAREKGRKDPGKIIYESYVQVIMGVVTLSLMLWAGYGTHSEGGDGLRDPGETVVDFEPTDRERNSHGLEMLVTLMIPALFGLRAARNRAVLIQLAEQSLDENKPGSALSKLKSFSRLDKHWDKLYYKAVLACEEKRVKSGASSTLPPEWLDG